MMSLIILNAMIFLNGISTCSARTNGIDDVSLHNLEYIFFQNMTNYGSVRISGLKKNHEFDGQCGPGLPTCEHANCCSSGYWCGNLDLHCKDPNGIDNRVSECGVIKRRSRIVGGQITKAHQYPWFASIVHRSYPRKKKYLHHLCGGSLLDKKWILTAAHCFYYQEKKQDMLTVKNTKIFLGHTYIHSKRNKAYIPKRIIRHKGFQANANTYLTNEYKKNGYATHANDIALVELEKPVEFSDKISHMCLTAPGKEYVGIDVTAIGYGKQENSEYSRSLKEVELSTITTDACMKKGPLYENLTSTVICAWKPEGGKDTCPGDSGGPLLRFENNKFIQIGITSLGSYPCGKIGKPAIYTKVSDYLTWIIKNTRTWEENGYNADVYCR